MARDKDSTKGNEWREIFIGVFVTIIGGVILAMILGEGPFDSSKKQAVSVTIPAQPTLYVNPVGTVIAGDLSRLMPSYSLLDSMEVEIVETVTNEDVSASYNRSSLKPSDIFGLLYNFGRVQGTRRYYHIASCDQFSTSLVGAVQVQYSLMTDEIHAQKYFKWLEDGARQQNYDLFSTEDNVVGEESFIRGSLADNNNCNKVRHLVEVAFYKYNVIAGVDVWNVSSSRTALVDMKPTALAIARLMELRIVAEAR